jgi:hypothetical protein
MFLQLPHASILFAIIYMAISDPSPVNYVCSAYCNANDCSAGLTKSTTDCGGTSNCRSQFVVINGNC